MYATMMIESTKKNPLWGGFEMKNNINNILNVNDTSQEAFELPHYNRWHD